VGDVPAIAMILVDGQVICMRARNTPFTDRAPTLYHSQGQAPIAIQDVGVLPGPTGATNRLAISSLATTNDT
jgi:hypothetical protein